jgi:hypothetical protein
MTGMSTTQSQEEEEKDIKSEYIIKNLQTLITISPFRILAVNEEDREARDGHKYKAEVAKIKTKEGVEFKVALNFADMEKLLVARAIWGNRLVSVTADGKFQTSLS